MMRRVARLWAVSAEIFEGGGSVRITRRIRFVLNALLAYRSVEPLLEASKQGPLGQLMTCRPETIGAVIWPYQCSSWDAQTRLARIQEHYAALEKMSGPINFPVHGRLVLLDLKEIREGLVVVLDQPKWFMREGQITINLFQGDGRIYSLSFSFFCHGTSLAAFVGAIQGRDIEGINDEYRELTKAAHGLRPRDLLLEAFRMLCTELGVGKIFAVADQYRHHRHSYFGKAEEKLGANYDEIWSDRGGVRVDPTCYELEVRGQDRDLATVSPKKRSMYRRRSEMLARLRIQVHERYGETSANEEGGDERKAEFSLYGRSPGP
jgi:uncharacterized protein